jgi:hypothetical protein
MPRLKRREFSVADRVSIVQRATDEAGLIHCERCGSWCKRRADYEIDHIIAEGMRPKADKKRKLVPADGQLLCLNCHPPKTKRDNEDINEAKRREQRALLLVRPGRRKAWWRHGKEQKPPLKVAAGPPALMRRGYEPAGGER